MSEYKIEKNLPYPSCPYPRNMKYPWDKMEVGDSFEVERYELPNATSAGHNYGRRNEKKFSSRGNRIWRIE